MRHPRVSAGRRFMLPARSSFYWVLLVRGCHRFTFVTQILPVARVGLAKRQHSFAGIAKPTAHPRGRHERPASTDRVTVETRMPVVKQCETQQNKQVASVSLVRYCCGLGFGFWVRCFDVPLATMSTKNSAKNQTQQLQTHDEGTRLK